MSTNGTTAIIESINDLLRQTAAGQSYELHVVPEATREDDEWLYVVVAPSRPGIGAYEFADVLARVEQQVREQKSRNEIMLVPARID